MVLGAEGEAVSMMEEEWRPIAGYEGWYEVSNRGEVRSTERVVVRDFEGRLVPTRYKERLLKKMPNMRGYLSVVLSRKGEQTRRPVHRLVAETFLVKQNDEQIVDHIDGDIVNNTVKNLRWVSRRVNNLNRRKSFGRSPLVGAYWHAQTPDRPWRAVGSAPGSRPVYLGSYATHEEAHEVWRKFRDEQIAAEVS